MSGQQITLTATDGGQFTAWLALPDAMPEDAPAGGVPGIVMLHEIFGVTGWIKQTAEMFAARGFCVIAPEMFWRLEPNFTADFAVPEQRQQGMDYKAQIDHGTAIDDIATVIVHLKSLPQCNGKIGVTGFCTGGTMAYLTAARLDVDAAAPYYGTQIHEFLDEGRNIKCPTVFHMGDRDDHVPADIAALVEASTAGLPGIAIHRYDAGHAFAHTQRADHYVKDACDAAHARTFELFDRLR